MKTKIKFTIVFLLLLFSYLAAFAKAGVEKRIGFTGAGSSFIYPIMSVWTEEYKNKTGIKVNYQSTGSATGINMFKSGAANFTATEIPVTKDQLDENNWIIFPAIASGVVPVVNISGIKNNQMVLSGQVLADIFMGNIKYWNDPAIQKLNLGVKLPNKNIIIVHRTGMSGTTYVFTSYLSKVSALWKQSIGSNSEVNWPDNSLGGRQNAGAAAYVKQIPNSIGYVDYTFIKDDNISCVKMINKSGNVVEASLDSFLAAVKKHPWNDANLVLNEAGNDSWPIVAVTYVLENKKNGNGDIQSFFKYVLSSEILLKKAHEMGYIVNSKMHYLK